MIDMHPPPAYIQIAQKPTPGVGQPLQLVPSQPPQPPAAPRRAGPEPTSNRCRRATASPSGSK